MDVVASIIELYFALMESINVRNVSIAIILVIIGIEFIEYYISPDEDDLKETHRKKPGKQGKNKLIRRVFGLEAKNKEMLERVSAEEPQAMRRQVVAAPLGAGMKEGEGLEDVLPPAGAGARVIGSRTYTVQTVLDGNYVYLEKLDGER
jgi:hypothetical protein